MRDETAEWLEPMLNEAEKRDIDILPLFYPASMPAAEAATPFLDWMAKERSPWRQSRPRLGSVRPTAAQHARLGRDVPSLPRFPRSTGPAVMAATLTDDTDLCAVCHCRPATVDGVCEVCLPPWRTDAPCWSTHPR